MLKNIKYLSIAFIFTACAVGPDYKTPQLKSFKTLQENSIKTSDKSLHSWWKNFNDPILNLLIKKAQDSNLDIKTAYLNIKKSKLAYNIVEEDFEPDLALVASSKRGHNSDNGGSFARGKTGNDFQVGLNVSWELDLFGRIDRLVEANYAKLQADKFLYQDVLISLKAEVISTYIQTRNIEDRILITKKNIKIQEDFLRLTQNLKNAGTASKLDVIRASTNLLITKSVLPTLNSNKIALIQKLSVLLNSNAKEIISILEKEESILPFIKNETIRFSSNLLRNRPDVRLKERELAAQTALIGVATTSLYPSLTLGGFLGYNSMQNNTLLSPESQLWNIGGSFLYSIFNRSKIKASIKIEETKALMALNEYKKTVLMAISEVNSNLSFYKSERIRYSYLQEAYSLNEESVHLAKLRYENGLSSFQEVLDSQRQLFSSEDKLSQSKSSISLYYVNIHKSFGLGWNTKNENKNK